MDHSPVSLNETIRATQRQTGHGGEFSLEKGMANHFSILALRTPWTLWKGKKDMTLKDELPRSVDVHYDTREEWRNNSRKNEETEPKQKQYPVWMWLMMEVKSDDVKNNIA